MSFLLSVFVVLLSATFSGCSSHKQSGVDYLTINEQLDKKSNQANLDVIEIKNIPQFEESANLVAPGFLFSLNHPTDDKLRGQYRVHYDGLLRLPYNVNIEVKGMTFEELRERVLSSYAKFFQRGGDDVSFQIVKRQYWVEVRGYVKKTGYYLVERKESIDKVIDKAGGLSGNLKQDFFIASIKQMDQSYSVSLNQFYEENAFGTSFTWTGGDTLFINILNEDAQSESIPTVSILGGVLTPGKTLYRDNASLFYYLGKAGGVIPNLGYDECYVIRRGTKGKVESIKFNITDIESIPVVKAGDVIMMNADKRTPMDKVFDRATQVATMLTTVAFLIIAF